VQGVDRVFDLSFNGRTDARKLTYGDVFLQAEQEYSRFNFEHADTGVLLQHFRDAEKECKALLEAGAPEGTGSAPWPEPSSDIAAGAARGLTPLKRHKLALPAYDQVIKASHIFNLLDARGVISVTERQSYILRVRELAKACCAAWLQTEGGGA
jgi:glycyl-tRNA synthetase alpha chain